MRRFRWLSHTCWCPLSPWWAVGSHLSCRLTQLGQRAEQALGTSSFMSSAQRPGCVAAPPQRLGLVCHEFLHGVNGVPHPRWGLPHSSGSLQVPPLQLVCSVPSAEPGQPPHCCSLGFGVVTGKMPPLSQSTRWQRFCVLQGLVKPPALWSQVGHPEPAYASKSSFWTRRVFKVLPELMRGTEDTTSMSNADDFQL